MTRATIPASRRVVARRVAPGRPHPCPRFQPRAREGARRWSRAPVGSVARWPVRTAVDDRAAGALARRHRRRPARRGERRGGRARPARPLRRPGSRRCSVDAAPGAAGRALHGAGRRGPDDDRGGRRRPGGHEGSRRRRSLGGRSWLSAAPRTPTPASRPRRPTSSRRWRGGCGPTSSGPTSSRRTRRSTTRSRSSTRPSRRHPRSWRTTVPPARTKTSGRGRSTASSPRPSASTDRPQLRVRTLMPGSGSRSLGGRVPAAALRGVRLLLASGAEHALVGTLDPVRPR